MTIFWRMGALFLILAFTGCFQSSSPSSKPLEGLWGGKWDDTWPVFIEIHPGAQEGEYKVTYYWLENMSDTSFSHDEFTTTKVGNHFESDKLSFILGEHSGMIQGQFKQPRMANLVRINGPDPKPETTDLGAAGWTPGAIPAEDALAKIKADELR